MPQPDELLELTLPERQAYANAQATPDRPYAEAANPSLANAVVNALEELNTRRGIERDATIAAGDRPASMDDLRAGIRAALEELVSDLVDARQPAGEIIFAAAHATAAAARAYSLLGGNLELPNAELDTRALEAELRVAELEKAIDDLRAALNTDPELGTFLHEGRLQPLGVALANVIGTR